VNDTVDDGGADAADGGPGDTVDGGRGDAVDGGAYDEFGLLPQNAAEVGLPWSGRPAVERLFVEVAPGQRLSALRWGRGEPELVLLHGGAQNAHTWDTVALALGRPLLALDLPGHGHSDWRQDSDYRPARNADAVAAAVRELAPNAAGVVGMSLGGLTAIRLASGYPDLVRRLVVVDVTPGTDRRKAAAIVAFVDGPESFASFDEILARTVEHNPGRSESSLRRGVLHNARQRDARQRDARQRGDGRWVWRYDRMRFPGGDLDFGPLWEDVSAVRVPLLLVRGASSPVVDDTDVAELLRRQPGGRVDVVEGSGHSVQGDQPLRLAELIGSFVPGPTPAGPAGPAR
jgi:pimeloyl-ACP methyl ester carboxylesterase